MVAEDNETNQRVISHQLGLLGYWADIASDGKEAFKRWRSGDYSLLLTDIHMPEMDGYELCGAIRESESGRARIPIVALTANALKGEAQKCYQAGADAYLIKPAPLKALQEVLTQWLPVDLPSHESRASEPGSFDAVAIATAIRPDADIEDVARFQEPVDIGVLKALVGDDPKVIANLLRDFVTSSESIGAEMELGFDSEDFHRIKNAAHKLKSSSYSVGAMALGDLCVAAELACEADSSEELAVIRTRLNQEVVQVVQHLIATVPGINQVNRLP